MAKKPKGNQWDYKEWAPSVKLTKYDRIYPELIPEVIFLLNSG